jgi:two-component system chemotaxis response regulator CheB
MASEQIREKNDIVESNNKLSHIVAIGTSTGGPRALQDVIPLIPGSVSAAFLVVQHMPIRFTKSLADRLNSLSELTVKEADDGEVIKSGHVYIAPGDFHMKVKQVEKDTTKIQLSRDEPVGGHRPSIDVMLKSLSDTGLKNLVAVIMTGMGGDGSEGIRKIKKVNRGYIIAQDEETSVVYGMPKSAVQTGAVDAVIPLKEIAHEILKILGVHT